jgi:cell division protein FtsB
MDRIVSQPARSGSVRHLAERLLAHAGAHPELIARRGSVISRAKEPHTRFPALALLSDPVLDVQPYLEDLVSIAVSAAQRADELSAEARRTSRKVRRQMLVVGCIGALGLLIGVAGLAAGSSSDARLAQLRDEMALLQDEQRQAQQQIAALNGSQALGLQTVQPPIATQIADRASPPSPAFKPPNIRYYTQPWPDSVQPHGRPP